MEKKVQFNSGDFIISGVLHLPALNHPPVVIGSHGLMSSGDSPKQIALARSCVENGIAYFRFDHRGCGKSTGDFASATTFEGRRLDLIRAVQTMLDHPHTGNRIALFGSSFGGAISIEVFHQFDTKALVTVAAPVRLDTIHPASMTDPREQALMESLSRRNMTFDISPRLPHVSNILIFHGDADQVVPFSNALEIHEKTKPPKKLIRQSNGDHSISNAEHQKAFIRLAVDWFKDGFHSEPR